MASNGCDSTVFTTLSVISPSYFEQTVTICQGSSYTAAGNTYTLSGVYEDTLVAANGCDSLITTNLFVESILYATVFESICYGTTYNFNGNSIGSTGTYLDTLTAVAGCDSVVTLNLTVEPLINTSFSVTICEGTSYTHGTQTLSVSGSYPEMFTSVDGCDSISTLYLFVTPQIENNIGVTICQVDAIHLLGYS